MPAFDSCDFASVFVHKDGCEGRRAAVFVCYGGSIDGCGYRAGIV